VIKLAPFKPSDFDLLISWIGSKELLLQISGNYFSYPLTIAQLQIYLEDKKSMAFAIVETGSNKTIGHAEIILLGNNVCKLDKILIGDQASRGKGLGQEIVRELLKFSFQNLSAERVELYVFDSNIAAIKSYEKSGFTLDKDKQLLRSTDGMDWNVLSMTMPKEKWLSFQ
jgi:RimJ/RimL family protein N-acetyltransferase